MTTIRFDLHRQSGPTCDLVATIHIPENEMGGDPWQAGDALVARLSCIFCESDSDHLYWTSPDINSPSQFDHDNHSPDPIDPEILDAANNHGQPAFDADETHAAMLDDIRTHWSPDRFDLDWSGAD